ncbi:hypothetical protein WJX74_001292 [Apatococcus lobatus]|uniref:T-complex-associated testis-expressed protein 1 n=2 Tax=Apatococcus TaxID=904362 RepID=A0AAW1TDP1_9CHLO
MPGPGSADTLAASQPLPVHLVSSLQEICVGAFATRFQQQPSLAEVPTLHLSDLVVEQLSTDLPLELAGSVLSHEGYWKRRSHARWPHLQATNICSSWKQLYFEQNLQEALERFDPELDDQESLRRLLAFSRRFVHRLELLQLPSHLDPQLILESLYSGLTLLRLTYGMRSVGMNYDKSLFGIRLSDCRALAHSLQQVDLLAHLDLTGNLIDDNRARLLSSGLANNHTITHLCLAHNKIEDKGIKAVAKALDAVGIIAILNLQHNLIGPPGGRDLARLLARSKSLTHLNMRLNGIGDEGAKTLLEAAGVSKTVQSLNLSTTDMREQGTETLIGLVRAGHPTLSKLDVTCNLIGLDAGLLLREAVESNPDIIMDLDVRACEVSQDDEAAIQEILRNRSLRGTRPFAWLMPTAT